MPLIALHTVLKAGREADYDRLHAVIPADLAAALHANGVRDWRIWRDGRDCFHLVDVEDYQAMRAGLRDHPANIAWQEQLAPLFDTPDSYDGDDDGIGFLWSLAEQTGTADGGPGWR